MPIGQMHVNLSHIADVRGHRQAMAVGGMGYLNVLRDAGDAGDVGLHIMYRTGMDESIESIGGI